MGTASFPYSVYASCSPIVGQLACVISKTSRFDEAFNAYMDLFTDSRFHTVVLYDANEISEANPLGIRFSKGL